MRRAAVKLRDPFCFLMKVIGVLFAMRVTFEFVRISSLIRIVPVFHADICCFQIKVNINNVVYLLVKLPCVV